MSKVKQWAEDTAEKAVDKMIDKWDMDTLVNFAYDDRVNYYLGDNVSDEEIELLMEENLEEYK